MVKIRRRTASSSHSTYVANTDEEAQDCLSTSFGTVCDISEAEAGADASPPSVALLSLDSDSNCSCASSDRYDGWSSDDDGEYSSDSIGTPLAAEPSVGECGVVGAASFHGQKYVRNQQTSSGSNRPPLKNKSKQQQVRITLSLKSPLELLRMFLLLLSVPSLLYSTKNKSRLRGLELSSAEAKMSYEKATEKLNSYNWGDNYRSRDVARVRVMNELLHEDLTQVRNESSVMLLNEENEQLKEASSGVNGANGGYSNTSELSRALERDAERHEKALLLIEDIQDKSERDAIERFGEGPHYVRIDLSFPPAVSSIIQSEGPQPQSSSFVVKLAPLYLMPHSVQVFLDAVSTGAYNDGQAQFDINAPHLVKTSLLSVPQGGVEDPSPLATTATVSDGLAFPEYSRAYPHLPYTLGFVAPSASSSRTRSSDAGFYVNTLDNSLSHGPDGAQDHHDSAVLGDTSGAGGAGGDPCFAEVVEGIEVIDRIKAMSLEVPDGGQGLSEVGGENEGEDGGGVPWMNEPVSIMSARIVSGRNRKTWRAPPWMGAR